MNSVAIITGAARGIGAETARALAADGVNLSLAVRNPDAASELVKELNQYDVEIIVVACDVSNHNEVANMVQTTVERLGRVDILVNNAGTLEPIALLEDADPEAWLNCQQVNIAGAYYAIREVLPYFRQQDSGTIINLSSGAAHHALRGWSAYCTSKAGLAMLTMTVAVEVSGADIRVYGFQPGMVDTRMTREGLKKELNLLSEKNLDDFFQPSAPAEAIATLCRHRPLKFHGGEPRLGDEDLMTWLESVGAGP